MTRDNHKKSNRSESSMATSHEDSIINLPDLSAYQEAEKRHIINVLIRDEDLRNKHLSRFMNLRKEVADLEQQSSTISPSVCARCQTPFGFVFNTGDACPKCGAKVCKQCRLMYNVNDNSWLCQLCCKQMQLMSYSGEWIYSIHSNLRKNSKTESEVFDEPLPASISAQNIDDLSSSDSDREIPILTGTKPDRFTKSAAVVTVKSIKPKDKVSKMIVQNSVDEQKLNFVKGRMKDRPLELTYTQPLPRRTRQKASIASTIKSSSHDMNSVINQSNNRQGSSLNKLNSPMPKNLEELKRNEQEVDLMSVTSSEWGGDDDQNKSEKEKLKVQSQQQQQNSQPSIRDSKLSLASTSTLKANQRHLSASMQNLRNRVHHRPRQTLTSSRQNLTSSRTSLNSEKNSKSERLPTPPIDDENTIPSKITDQSSISNSRTTIRSRQTSVNFDESKQTPSNLNRQESTNTTISTNTTASKPLQRHISVADSVVTEQTDYSRQDSLGNRSSVGDSGDDIDRKFEKAKTGSVRRASSLRDLRGSRLSLNSLMSEAKARYELEITGTIEFKLSYNTKTGSFDIFIRQCTNLARAKRNQTSNPYCKVYLLPDKSKSSKRKTGTRKGTTDPVFGETLRYHLSLQEFTSRTLWISVWSESSSLGQNDFLGEVHVPLSSCKFDELQEYKLLPRAPEEIDLKPVAEATTDPSELYFELSFIENTKNKQKGTIQVNAIQGKSIYQGKNNVEAICKGLLMPDKVKKKLPITRQGPSPKWDIPLRWDDIQLSDLKNASLEISIWNQERFRKTMIGSVRLNSTRGHLESRAVKTLIASDAEKAVWEAFQRDPTRVHKVRLPLRPAPIERK